VPASAGPHDRPVAGLSSAPTASASSASIDPPPAADQLFGDRLPLVQRYAARLAGDGVVRGLIGPRVVPRLWDRHLLNCAVVADLLPTGARLVDVGSGAGLPGIVLACRRSDLVVDLVDSLARRVTFLNEVVDELELTSRVHVVHGRAEDPVILGMVGDAPWVTARAVAPLDRLVRWCLPLLQFGGTLLAMKGAQAESEVQTHKAAIGRLGGEVSIVTCGRDVLDTPVKVVAIRRVQARTGSHRGRR
jgi:16S rRNA (guanine527-N7)-methyltransferase